MKVLKVRATLIEDMLGTLPSDDEIYKTYVASKSENPNKIKEETDLMEDANENNEFEKGVTVFIRNKDNEMCVYDYLIKGFFKNACSAMRECDGSESKGLTSYKRKIDNLVFPEPRLIKINIAGEDGMCERPLRASTPQGERIALASSESVPAGSTLEFSVVCLDDKMMKYVIEWLNYGKYNGLGQWHNSGKGRFIWEDITNK